MTPTELIDIAIHALGYLTALGILAALGVWALYAAEGRAERRRKRIRDAKRRHPAGKAIQADFESVCVICRNPFAGKVTDNDHLLELLRNPTCPKCADVLAVLDKEATS
jgi:hypothetical protein